MSSKLVRWRLKLEEFDYEITYKKGKANTKAEALSRIKISDADEKEQDIFNNDEDGDTVHSAQENLNDGIPISQKPINDFSIRIILETNDKECPMTVGNVFKNKQRGIIRRTTFDEDTMIDIFKKFFPPNKLIAIHTTDEMLSLVQSIFSMYFSQNRTLCTI